MMPALTAFTEWISAGAYGIKHKCAVGRRLLCTVQLANCMRDSKITHKIKVRSSVSDAAGPAGNGDKTWD